MLSREKQLISLHGDIRREKKQAEMTPRHVLENRGSGRAPQILTKILKTIDLMEFLFSLELLDSAQDTRKNIDSCQEMRKLSKII